MVSCKGTSEQLGDISRDEGFLWLAISQNTWGGLEKADHRGTKFLMSESSHVEYIDLLIFWWKITKILILNWS